MNERSFFHLNLCDMMTYFFNKFSSRMKFAVLFYCMMGPSLRLQRLSNLQRIGAGHLCWFLTATHSDTAYLINSLTFYLALVRTVLLGLFCIFRFHVRVLLKLLNLWGAFNIFFGASAFLHLTFLRRLLVFIFDVYCVRS